MAYVNQNGQVRIGVRSGLVNTPVVQPAFSASLLQSIYGIWNGDTTTNELGTSLFGAWNGEDTTNTLGTNIYSVFTDTTTYTHSGVTSSQFGLWDAEGLGLNDKIGTNHLTSFGSATFSTDAILGTKSFTFNGSNYFGLPANSWNFTGDFSLSFWVKSNWPGSGGVIPISNNVWVQTSPTIKYSGWDIRTSGPFPIFYGVSGGTTSFYIQSAVQCVNNVWSNVVVTKSDSVVSIYVNGLLGGTSSVTGNITYAATSYPSIGAQKYSSAGVSDYIGNGSKIDDVAVWTRVLTHDDVIAIYNSGSGQSYPYSLPTVVSVDKYQSLKGFVIGTGSSTVSGKTGNAISLTQSSAIILKDRSALKFTGDFSVSFWFRTPDVTTGKALISTSDGTKGWWIYIASGNILWYSGGSANVNFGFNPTTLVANTWYHVVVSVANNVDVSCYLNGVLGGYQSMVSKTITYDYWNGFHPSVIGGRANRNVNTSIEIDYRFTGIIDDVVTWNRKLTLNEVNQLYNGTSGVEYPYSGKSLSSPNDNFGTNHGTLMNGCTFTTGKIGSAFTFDGINDYVALPDNIFNFTGDFSSSAWFYSPSATYTHSGIVGNYNFATGTGWGIYTYQNRLYAQLGNIGGNYSATFIDNSVVGSWNHVVMVFKKGTGFYLYMNGELKSSFTLTNNSNAGTSPSYSATQKAYIGLLNYSGDWWYAKNGYKIDGVNVWQRAISQDEITQLYNSGTGAQYPFTGTFSSAGNQLGMDNGTMVNGCYLSTGKVGQAFTFDGVNDYVQLPDNSFRFAGDFSISVWINSTTGEGQIFENWYSTTVSDRYGWALYLQSGRVRFATFNVSTNIGQSATPITANTWWHIVITKKPSNDFKMYINGDLQTTQMGVISGNISTNPLYNTISKVNIGSNIGYGTSGSSRNSFFSGKIDSLNVWSKELTQAEITELYNSGTGKQITATPIIQTGLVLNLDASRSSSYTGTGTTWTDISGSGNSGTFIGNPTYNNSDSTFTFSNSNYIKSTTGGVTGNTTRTVSIWFKINGLASNDSNWSVTDQIPFSLGSTTGGNLSFAINISYYAGGNTIMKVYGYFTQYDEEITISGDNLGNNQWRNITVTWNGLNPGTLGVYIDGVFKTSLLRSSGEVYNTSAGYIVGTWADYNRYYTNKLGSVLVYNRVLTSNEILQNYNATKSRFGL